MRSSQALCRPILLLRSAIRASASWSAPSLALGRLDSITLLLPDPNIFLYAYIRREADLSSQIEGTQSTLADLLLFELEESPGVPFDDIAEVSGYVAALEHG